MTAPTAGPTGPLVKPLPDVAGNAIMSQRDTRVIATIYDQHKSPRFPNGRPWWGYFETPANRGTLMMQPSYVGSLMPGDHKDPWGSTWDAPWLPPNALAFYKVNYYAQTLRFDYDQMHRVYQGGYREHYRKAVKVASERGWPAPALGADIGFQITSVIGPCPPHPRIIEAARAGDPWILGFTDEVNEELQHLLSLTNQRIDHLEEIPLPSSTPTLQVPTNADGHAAVSADLIQLLVQQEVDKRMAAPADPGTSAKKPITDAQRAQLAAARESRSLKADA